MSRDECREFAHRWTPTAWALLLGLVMLGPALGPGYVLSYDMVWVPDLALRSDFLGVSSALPRAVPSDAVLAVVDEVIPGMVLQKLVLLGSLVAAGAGAACLVGGPMTGRLAATTFAVWNPFVVERLVLGHWPILLGYAVLPWLVIHARVARKTCVGPVLILLLPLGSLSAGAGLVTALVTLLFAWSDRVRHNVLLVAVVSASNAPWLISGLLHVASATSDPAGASLFALRGEGYLPAPLAAFGLGGIWNAEVVPATRDGVLAIVMTAVIALVAAAGMRPWWSREDRRDRLGLLVLWVVGWGWAVCTWAAPSAAGWLASHVPGGGLLRDGSRFLALCLPLLLVLIAHGVVTIRGLIRDKGAGTMVALGLVLLPLATMPDAAWGASGTLRAADYPAGFDSARAAIAESQKEGEISGDVVVLPFSAYRAPEWNNRHKVLDPLPRFLGSNYVSNDELLVDRDVIRGEDPRVPQVRGALAEPSAQRRAEALAVLGIRFVVIDSSGPDGAPSIAGAPLSDQPPVTVIELDNVMEQSTPARWWLFMGLAWVCFLGPGAIAAGRIVLTRRRRHPK